ncbi:MAG: hypothetical protein M1812_001585 [Candelaria pacifica]|nr:MAG: hypothetical protein M1812_001585 [Candelaria pacifica]
MALDHSGRQRSTSPISSGQASPAPRQLTARAEDNLLRKDKSYRRYSSNVERALSLFDTTLQEWADYISFLGRLLKALQTHPSDITAVPRSEVVARRLAQCLNPSLPSGVHQKALELYAYIFSLIGKDALARDLALYLPGLTSTLSFASLSVRPYFLSLVESHLLVLHASALRPAVKALILALLPGLEDETSEDFDRTFRVLEDLQKVIKEYQLTESEEDHGYGDEYFWQCLFLASITSPGRRQGALSFLVRKLPRLGGIRVIDNKASQQIAELSLAAEAIIYPEPGLLVRCFAAGLSDEQVLIQRGFLDLLVTHLPLDSPVLQDRVTPEDLDRLITAAVGVVTRREMSLNRRLWTWFLGPESKADSGGDVTPNSPTSLEADFGTGSRETLGNRRTKYFSDHGLQSLIRSIRSMINRDYQSVAAKARPFRICLSLMDRWEVGGLVVPEIFLSVVQSVQKYKAIAPTKEDFGDVLRSASVFFDGVESGLIWGELVRLIATALSSSQPENPSRQDKLRLVDFVLEYFNVREEEMLITHMPLVTLAILTMMDSQDQAQGKAGGNGDVSREILDLAFKIADQLVTAIPQRAFLMDLSGQRSGSMAASTPLQDLPNQEILESIRTFYAREQGNIELSSPPFSTKAIGVLLLRQATSLVNHTLQANNEPSLEIRIKLLTSLISKAPKSEMIHQNHLFPALQQYLTSNAALHTTGSSFPTFSAIVSLATSLYSSITSLSSIFTEQFAELLHLLVCRAWSYLSPTTPKYHVETVRCLWHLQSVEANASKRWVEASLSTLISASDMHEKSTVYHVDSARRFAVLWTHSVQAHSGNANMNKIHPSVSTVDRELKSTSWVQDFEVMLTRPLFLLLDTLATEGTQLFVFTKDWIENLPSIHKLFQVLAMKFLAFEHLVPMSVPLKSGDSVLRQPVTNVDDPEECLYYLRTLSSILRWSSDNVWSSLANQKMSGPDEFLSMNLQRFFVEVCMRLIAPLSHLQPALSETPTLLLRRAALFLLKQLLLSPFSAAMGELELENPLVECLHSSIRMAEASIQVLLLDVVYAALKLRLPKSPSSTANGHRRTASKDTIRSSSRLSLSLDRVDKEQSPSENLSPPPKLVKCIQNGISSKNSRPVLESWTTFLADCLPLYSETIFQILIPLVECLCIQIRDTFAELRATFRDTCSEKSIAPESTLILLLNGLEQTLARAHERLTTLEVKSTTTKSPEQPQGFFGNMVSGVFSSEGQVSRSANANDRLTVLLSFQDTVRICFSIWSWGGYGPDGVGQDPTSHASFTYTSLRMRNRARRILEHLFAAESLECLETLAVIWRGSTTMSEGPHPNLVFDVLHVLDGSRPKNTIPAVFNAIYSRTNPNALEPMSKSTLTSDLTETDVVAFLVEYARSLEDDAMDEIWIDCMTFLRDVLANPFPHRQTLPRLLEFTAILGEKVDNTNFGEQRKMRRDLGDIFTRLLTASFTTKPISFSQDMNGPVVSETSSTDGQKLSNHNGRPQIRPDDIVTILVNIVSRLPTVIFEVERIAGIASSISTNVIGPTFRSKSYPDNISKSILDLLYQLAKIPNTSKSWRKDLSEAFNDPKFFANALTLVDSNWLPLLGQWALVDKDRLPELLSRIPSPTTAGIMFGVGASSARLEADRRTQLNLRRIAVLILAAADDSFVTDLTSLEAKLVELLAATAASSPSSATRAEVYMVFRALVLKISAVHLAPLWPIINSELHSAISSVFPGEKSDLYSAFAVLQACKLLDTLLTIAPDEFQLHEWLFITDTIDAVYRPTEWNPVALVDELSDELGSSTILPSLNMGSSQESTQLTDGRKKPLLNLGGIKNVDKDDIVGKVLKPFFSQLSIYAFESTYAMSIPDWQTCRKELLSDLFDETTIVG